MGRPGLRRSRRGTGPRRRRADRPGGWGHPPALASRVPVPEADRGEGDRRRRVPAEEGEARPRAHAGTFGGERVDGLTGGHRQVAADVVLPVLGQGGHEGGEDQQQAEQRRDCAGGRAEDEAEPEAHQADDGQVGGGADDRPPYPRGPECHPMRAEHRHPGQKRGQRGRQADGEGDRGEGHGLGPQDRQPPGDRRQGGPDHPVGVLAGGEQDAEDADGQLAEEHDAEEVLCQGAGGPVEGVEVDPTAVHGPAGDHGQPDHTQDGEDQGDDGGAQAAELDPLRAQHPGPADRLDVDRPGERRFRCGGTGQRRGGHDVLLAISGEMRDGSGVAAPPRNSTESAVSAMKASSSETSSAASSWRAMPWAQAMSPICSAVTPWTRRPRTASATGSTVTSGPARRPDRRVASGVRTRTMFREALRMNSAIDTSASTRPRPTMRRWSAVSAISLMRWLETRTVRPSLARPRSRLRIQRTPSGSSPLTGSSRTTVAGSARRAAAIPSRWPIPSENFLTRLRATSVSPTRSMTSSTRRTPMPWVAARASRWLRAERPLWTARASRRAPTSARGAPCSA